MGLSQLPGIDLDVTTVETNIIRFKLTSMHAGEFVDRLHANGVYMLPNGSDAVRALTYLNIFSAQVDQAVEIVMSVLK